MLFTLLLNLTSKSGFATDRTYREGISFSPFSVFYMKLEMRPVSKFYNTKSIMPGEKTVTVKQVSYLKRSKKFFASGQPTSLFIMLPKPLL
jgi:hypothetical protein